MTTRIAFLSCVRIGYKDQFDPSKPNYPCEIDTSHLSQPIWDQLLREHTAQPFDSVLFLGDQIYTDYGIHGFLGFQSGGSRPKGWTPQRFHDVLYTMYKTQYDRASNFKQLLQALHASGTQIGMIWDDHDFGYNNGVGTEPKFADKRAIAKRLFEQFRDAVTQAVSSYPASPFGYPLPAGYQAPTYDPLEPGIEKITTPINLPNNIEILQLDGRFHRAGHAAGDQFLGMPQWTQLSNALRNNPTNKLQIVCCGAPYSLGKESWSNAGSPLANFNAFNQIIAARTYTTIYLSGDIHINAVIQHANVGRLCEVVSSGAANVQCKKGWFSIADANANFGILHIDERNIKIDLYEGGVLDSNLSQTIPR